MKKEVVVKYFIILFFVFSSFAHAQTVVSVKDKNVIVDSSSGRKLQIGEKVEFLDSELKVTGEGEVKKVSGSGSKVLVVLTSGDAKPGMTLESTNHQPDPEVRSESQRPAQPKSREGLSSRDQKILAHGPIDNTSYILGGVLGTWPLGLGIGQAIQGRYSETGWIFTVGELASAGVLFAGIVNCIGDSNTRNSCDGGLVTVGVLGIIGFKIWEIFDLWYGPQYDNERYIQLKGEGYVSAYKLSPVFAPVANYKTGQIDGGMFGLKLSF